jgi:glycosyltransferase involved in cell wall biosynthesis
MKIATIHNTYQQPGGEDVVVAEETRLLESYGHKVVSYRRSNHELDDMSTVRRLIQIKDVVHSSRSKNDIQSLIRKEKPDVVHVHNTFLMISPSAYEACRQEGVPIVQTLHNYRLLCPAATLSREGVVCEECIHGDFWSGIRHGCYRNSSSMTSVVAAMLKFHQQRGTWKESVDGYVALSEFARDKFTHGGLPAEKIHVKPNFVGSDPGPKTGSGEFVLFVGRLVPEKGPDLLLSAWGHLKNAPKLMIIGDGPSRDALQRQIESTHLRNVRIMPWMPKNEVMEAIQKASVLVVPSTWYEGFPMTIVEAFACGTPVICSRLGALQEIVTDECTGLHFRAGDALDLADKVESLLGNSERVARMGREARQRFEERYTAPKNYLKLMNIYEQTIAAHSRN